MRTVLKAAFILACCMMLAAFASATPITYTETAIASGSLGGVSFTDATVTLTMNGDTSDVADEGGGFFQNIGTLLLDVSGVGTATFTSGSYGVFDNETFSPPAAGGFQFSPNASILDTFDNAFATYDLTTAIGPITGSSFINPGLGFATSAGTFILDSAGDSTFTAVTSVPEPGSMVLLGSGLAGLAGMIRRFRK